MSWPPSVWPRCSAARALAAGSGPSGSTRAPIEAQVLRQLATKGHASFWVVLRDQADVSAASRIHNRVYARRGRLQAADRVRARRARRRSVRCSMRKASGISRSGSSTRSTSSRPARRLLDAVAARPDVRGDPRDSRLPDPEADQGSRRSSPLTTEWGLNAIHAPQVWSTFNDRGEGIVVASIDTGRPLHASGPRPEVPRRTSAAPSTTTTTGGTRSHECPTAEPCDTDTHGTHTMGTMVGDDGDPGANQIGVAPHAKWIAAKGCCLDVGAHLVRAVDSRADRPERRRTPAGPAPRRRQQLLGRRLRRSVLPPGGSGVDRVRDLSRLLERKQRARPVALPALRAITPRRYSAGAFARNGTIAGFSSRGPSAFGGDHQARHRRAGRQRPLLDERRRHALRSVERDLDGLAPRRRHGRADLVGVARAARRRRAHTGTARPDRGRRGRHDLRRHRGEQQRLGRGEARRPRRRHGGATGRDGTLAGSIAACSGNPPIAGAEVRVAGPANRGVATDPDGHLQHGAPGRQLHRHRHGARVRDRDRQRRRHGGPDTRS